MGFRRIYLKRIDLKYNTEAYIDKKSQQAMRL